MRKLIVPLLIFLAAGCSRGAPPPPPVVNPPSTPPPVVEAPPSPPPVAGPAAEGFLPKPGQPYSYALSDGTSANEWFVRDGDRLIGAYNGKTYVTWFVRPDGVWRPDPKGQALLRYLPPVMQPGLAWKQQSGADEVWFRLAEKDSCNRVGRGMPCWELTVLNRMERTVFRFTELYGIIYASSDNFTTRSDSYIKAAAEPAKGDAPPREQMLKDGARLPAEPLPAVTEVTVVQFDQAEQALLTRAGARREIDLNGDGKPEVINGPLGQWTTVPFAMYDGNGNRLEHAFFDLHYPSDQHRLDLVKVKGHERMATLYQVGRPGKWHWSDLRWLVGNDLRTVWGWQPKTNWIWAATVRVDPDGTVVALGDPDEMGGYTWTRYYGVDGKYIAVLEREEVKAGAYPADPAGLLTAALVAKWFGQDADLARYIPDGGARNALVAAKISKPNYTVEKAMVGKLVPKESGDGQWTIPAIEAAPVAMDQPVDWLVEVGQYEGYYFWSGRVTFGREPDGRLVIRKWEVTADGFIY